MEKLLKGEIALVTGASRGIGRAIALEMAKAGAEVLINFLNNEEKAVQLCEEIRNLGGEASCARFDVSNPTEIDETISAILNTKKISIIVNNAGITKDGLIARYSLEDWDRVLNTNLRSAFFVSQAVLKSMIKERKGSIINISSVVGIIGNPGQGAYCAAKAGLIGLTKSMAKELASRNIRVNAIAPGFIQTEMTGALNEAQKEALLKNVALGRVGTAEEVANAALFLASSRSSYMTGHVISIDGGLAM